MGVITDELFLVDGDYTLHNMRPVVGGVTAETATPESEAIIIDHLRSRGWTVVSSPLWRRYELIAPLVLQHMRPEDIVRGLILRNRVGGLPPDSLRIVSSRTEGGGDTGHPQRLRLWVDASPVAEEYLRAHDNLLRTVAAAVRLRPATRDRRPSDRV